MASSWNCVYRLPTSAKSSTNGDESPQIRHCDWRGIFGASADFWMNIEKDYELILTRQKSLKTIEKQVRRRRVAGRNCKDSLAQTKRIRAELMESGMEAEERKRQEFFDLVDRFRDATDPEEAKWLGDQLGRMLFGG